MTILRKRITEVAMYHFKVYLTRLLDGPLESTKIPIITYSRYGKESKYEV
jgi:hypothetical protein